MEKVLIINLGREYGGAEKVIENLIFNIENQLEIHLAILEKTNFEKVIKEKKYKNYISLKNDKKKIIKIILDLIKYIKNNEIDIIHAHGVTAEIVAIIVSQITRKKLITTIHSRADYDIKNKLKAKIYIYIQRMLVKFNEKYILVSEELKLFFLEKSLKKDKLTVIENGIKALEKKSKSEKSENLTLCSVGRLAEVKRHDNLIKALSELKKEGIEVICLIAGVGELENSLKELVKKENLQDNILFLGFIEDVRDVFDISDMMIIQSDMEGLPIILLEAMSYKLPIISHSIGGIKSILTENNAVILENNSVETIKIQIKKILNKEFDLNEKQSNAYKIFKEKYDLKIFINKHIELYKSLSKETFSGN